MARMSLQRFLADMATIPIKKRDWYVPGLMNIARYVLEHPRLKLADWQNYKGAATYAEEVDTNLWRFVVEVDLQPRWVYPTDMAFDLEEDEAR